MNPYDLNPGGDEPRRWLEMAEKLLNNRDLLESKSFATRARESDPNLDEADQILAIVDTLIAGEKQISKNHLDWYAILRLARRTHDMELIASQYRRLGVLLNPNRNKFAFAEHAFKIVTEAWLVLSDPAKKFQFDNEFGNSSITKFNFMQQHFEPPPLSPVKQHHQQQEHNNNHNHNSSSIHIGIMQEHSEQLHQTMPMQQQFVQPLVQQQLFPPQPVHSFNEGQQWQQQQQHTQPLSPQLHWSNQSQQTLLRPLPQQPSIVTQPKQTWLQPPQPQCHTQPQERLPQSEPQEPLHWSQNVPRSPPLLQPQPGIQQPLPGIEESSPEPRSPPQSQPEKPPPESREQMGNGARVNLEENGNDDDNHGNNVYVEEPPSFWTVCAYCYSMYEYPGIYCECTLQCQNCGKAFHAVRVEAPPKVAEGEEAYIFCWGFFPIGVSTSYLEKRKAEALSWTPFSKMYAFPKGGNIEKRKNVRNSGPRIYVDDDGEAGIFDGISSNEESDEDWSRVPKNKKARRFRRKVYATRKAKQQKVYREDEVQGESDMQNLQSGGVTQEGSGVNGPDAEVLSVPDAEVSSVPVVEAKNKVDVPTRKQPGRVAKDLRE